MAASALVFIPTQGWFPHAAGEDSNSIGLFQQSSKGWGEHAR